MKTVSFPTILLVVCAIALLPVIGAYDYLSEWGIVLDDTASTDFVNSNLTDCAEGATSHGSFVSCVAQLVKDLQIEGRITKQEAQAIRKAAATSQAVEKTPAEGIQDCLGGGGTIQVSLQESFNECYETYPIVWIEFKRCAKQELRFKRKSHIRIANYKALKKAITCYRSTFEEDETSVSNNSTETTTTSGSSSSDTKKENKPKKSKDKKNGKGKAKGNARGKKKNGKKEKGGNSKKKNGNMKLRN